MYVRLQQDNTAIILSYSDTPKGNVITVHSTCKDEITKLTGYFYTYLILLRSFTGYTLYAS